MLGVLVGVGVAVDPSTTERQTENSEVLPEGSVAVAVIKSPAGTPTGRTTLTIALQLPLVVAMVCPR